MVRAILEVVVIAFVMYGVRMILNQLGRTVTGKYGSGARAPDRRGVLVRDPICGVFVLQDRAVTLNEGGERIFFCSEACRDFYRRRSA